MAKKGGVQQLQTEVNTDEDLEKFMDRDGLLVMDVYTDWCGPCIGMVGSLKKIKLELGGDNLQLAVCKSDGIESLKRFRNKSEPTWLFGSSKKIINIMFGTNVPKLMKLIADELDNEKKYRDKEIDRTFYELTELTPIEQEIENTRIEIENEQIRIEKEAADLKRRQYITHVTDEIISHLPDMGVTILMPHIAKERDIYKKLVDPADKCDLITKDKKFIQIKETDLEILHFECDNPLSNSLLAAIYEQDLLGIVWKIADTELRQVEEVIGDLVNIITISQPKINEDGTPDAELSMPPMMRPFEITLKDEDKEEVVEESVTPSSEEIKNEKTEERKSSVEVQTEEKDQEKEKVEISEKLEEKKVSITGSGSLKAIGSKIILDNSRKVKVPAIWAPKNKRAHAAMIFLYFRNFTDHFLPPDPIPEPPHVLVIFDAFKRRDIFEVMEQYTDAILAYGYFTSGDQKTAELIAKSTENYQKKKPATEDKLIVKVAKVTSHALLSLVTMGPSYVSLNSESGRDECLKFFPPGFKNVEEEEEQEVETIEKKKGKKGRKGKHKKESDGSLTQATDASSSDLIEEDGVEENYGEEELGEEMSSQISEDKPSESVLIEE